MNNFSFANLTNMLPSLTSPTNEDPVPPEQGAEESRVEPHDAESEPQAIDPRPLTPDNQKPKSNIQLINECDNFPYFHNDARRYMQHVNTYYHLQVAAYPDVTLGYVLPSVAEIFRGVPAWELNDDDRTLTLVHGKDQAERSAIVASTCSALRETGHFTILKGWRNELYPVYGPKKDLLFSVERAASALLGVVTYGCHMTAYVRSEETDEIKIWTPRRAKTKQTYGGMLDNTVAGGIATGEDAFEGLVREAAEEASLPEDIVRKNVTATGVVSYFHIRDSRAGGETGLLQPEVQYIYDLELPEDVIPKPSDDEVEEFYLLTVDEVKEKLRDGEFKPNCAVVLLDFFVRHGFLTAREDDYIQIVARLHRLLEFPTK